MSSEWTSVSLREIASLKTGKLDSNASENNGKFPFFTCSPTTLAINTYAFDTKAVILAGNNANGVFSTKYYSGKFNAYQRTYVIEPLKPNIVCCKYLYFVISHLVGHLKELSIGSATKFLTKTILDNLAIKLPPKLEQDRISALLFSIDDRITLLRETNTTLEAIAQALFKSWFVDFDPVHTKMQGREPEGMDAETAALFPDSFEESELGLVPKGWRVGAVGDQAECVGGGTPDTKNSEFWEPAEFSWTTPKDLSGLQSPVLLETERKLSAAGIKKVSSGLLPDGTLLMSSRAPIGYLAIAKTPVAINQGYIAMLPGGVFPPLYLLFWCQQNMDVIKNHANGSTFMEISKKAFRPLPTVIPNGKIVEKFSEVAISLFNRLVENERQARSLSEIRDTLLPRLISGQLRLPEAETAIAEAVAKMGTDLFL